MAQLSTDLLRFRIRVACQLGCDSAQILKLADLPADFMESGPALMDLSVERKLWRILVRETGREDLGLICGDRLPAQAISILGYVMANSATLRLAIEKYCVYQRILGDSMGFVMEQGPHTTRIKLEQWTDWHDPLRYTVDILMAVLPSWASKNIARAIQPLQVGFHYQPPADTTPHTTYFAPASVRFGEAASYQIYDNEAMDQPIFGANTEMFAFFDEKAARLLSAYEGRDTVAHKTRTKILGALKGTIPTVDQIASELAVSVRKLQQSLSDEGTSFSELLNDVRRDLAKQYLKDGGIDKTEIAYLLGYSELSVFSRSFKKWTGLTPSQFLSQ